MTVTELVQWYKQCLNVLAWSEHKAFIDPYIVGVGCYTELNIIADARVLSEWEDMKRKMLGQFLHDSAALMERIRYKMQRRKDMVVFADVNAALGARSNHEQLPEENGKAMKTLTQSGGYLRTEWRIFTAGSPLSTVESMVRETLLDERPMGETYHVVLSLQDAEGSIVLPTVDEMKSLIKGSVTDAMHTS